MGAPNKLYMCILDINSLRSEWPSSLNTLTINWLGGAGVGWVGYRPPGWVGGRQRETEGEILPKSQSGLVTCHTTATYRAASHQQALRTGEPYISHRLTPPDATQLARSSATLHGGLPFRLPLTVHRPTALLWAIVLTVLHWVAQPRHQPVAGGEDYWCLIINYSTCIKVLL